MMRRILLIALVTGCSSEHGSTAPDAFVTDAKLFLDAQVTTCFAQDGSAHVMVTPGAMFGRVYAGAILLIGPVAPAKVAGAPSALRLLFTNAPEADNSNVLACDGFAPSCTTDGLAVMTKQGVGAGAEVGSHRVTMTTTTGTRASVDGDLTITEFVDPFDAQPGHITGTVTAKTPTTTVSGSFSTPFCPPFLTATI